MLQNATPFKKSAPWPSNISDEHVFCVLRLPREMHLWRPSSNVPRLPSLLNAKNPHVWLTFDKVHNPLRLPRESASERPKVVRTWCVLYDFEICFAPQRHGLFRHLNFQKWSEHGVVYTFWLRNVLRATGVHFFRHPNFQKWSEPSVFCAFWLRNVLRVTTACTFSTSQLPQVVRAWCLLYILT